jgi:hypothetical protein
MRRALVLLLATGFLAASCGGSEQAAAPAEPAAPPPAATTGAPEASSTAADGLPVIVVATPAPGERVTSPVAVSGTADVFEANVTVAVLDARGRELARDFTTATCGTGCRGDYSIELPFSVEAEQPGTIVVHDDDAAGTGTPPHVVEIPVTLAPS